MTTALDLPPQQAGRRDTALDLYKSFLFAVMIVSHATALFYEPGGVTRWWYAPTVRLLAFSGFFFAFGCGSYLAYYRRPWRMAWPRMVRTGLRTLLVYYGLGLLSLLFVEQAPFSGRLVADLLLMNRFPRLMEFLLPFVWASWLGALFFPAVLWLTAGGRRLALGSLAAAATTLLPDGLLVQPWFAQLIGSEGYSTFPLLPYLPMFLLGIYVTRHRLHWHDGLFAVLLLGALAFGWQNLLTGQPPLRFPPALLYVWKSFFIAYAAFLLVKRFDLSLKRPAAGWLLRPGREMLFYFSAAHVVLFAMKGIWPDMLNPEIANILIGLAAIGLTAGLDKLWITIRKRRITGPDLALQPPAAEIGDSTQNF